MKCSRRVACGGTVGYSIVEFTATDDCGNASSTTATFTIEDTTARPSTWPLPTRPSSATAKATRTPQRRLDNLAVLVQRHLRGVTWSHDFDGLSDLCGATGAATVTFTATDDCGNASSTSATFTIESLAPTPNSYDVSPTRRVRTCSTRPIPRSCPSAPMTSAVV